MAFMLITVITIMLLLSITISDASKRELEEHTGGNFGPLSLGRPATKLIRRKRTRPPISGPTWSSLVHRKLCPSAFNTSPQKIPRRIKNGHTGSQG